MLKDIPYSTLKKDRRGYGILTLRDQHSFTFKEIATEYGITLIRAREIYNKMQIKQIRLYIRHVSIALGYSDTSEVYKVFRDAYECYQNPTYVRAYLERKYADILAEYRAGEPGLPDAFLRNPPPLKQSLDEQTVSRIVELRERRKASFPVIAKELEITPERARHVYDHFYHQKLLSWVYELQEAAETPEERRAIWQRYMDQRQSAKKRYETLINETNNHQAR
ncbi:MAG: hypothetical protein HFF18_03940 [Oscillospiraceae bacterium]|nr:hypothetical protein [Oscillospiraceae bacterium]